MDAAEGFCFAVADDPRFLARSAAKYTKTEKINVVDLFVDIARKIIKILTLTELAWWRRPIRD